MILTERKEDLAIKNEIIDRNNKEEIKKENLEGNKLEEDKLKRNELKEEATKDGLVKREQEKIDNNEKKNENKILKVAFSVGRVFEEFIDSFAKKKLKEKYNLNYSVYNDGKKAIIAATKKDDKTFWKKATDSVLNAIKKIPTDTRKIIKNTKNAVIDEIFSWRKKE